MSWDMARMLMASLMAVTDAVVGYERRDLWHIAFSLLWAFIAGLFMAKSVMPS